MLRVSGEGIGEGVYQERTRGSEKWLTISLCCSFMVQMISHHRGSIVHQLSYVVLALAGRDNFLEEIRIIPPASFNGLFLGRSALGMVAESSS